MLHTAFTTALNDGGQSGPQNLEHAHFDDSQADPHKQYEPGNATTDADGDNLCRGLYSWEGDIEKSRTGARISAFNAQQA